MCFWSVTRIVGSWAYKGLRGPAFPLSLSSSSGLPYLLLSYPSTSSPKLKMGGLLYIYRLGSLSEFSSPSSPRPCSHMFPLPTALATITAVIVLGLCISSTTTFHQVVDAGILDPQSLNYTNIGIASGAMVIVALPVMYVCLRGPPLMFISHTSCRIFVDFINEGQIGLPVLIEVPWLCMLRCRHISKFGGVC